MSKRICICAGHGKSGKGIYDPGALSRDGRFHEHKLAVKIAKYASEYLNCDALNLDGTKSLVDRINAVNKGRYDFAADIHLNAGGGTGTEVYYYHGSPTGKRAAEAVTKEISETLGIKNRGAKVRLNRYGNDYFGFIRSTKPCTILIECAFIDCENDLKKVCTEEGCKKCGEAIGRALEKALGGKSGH